MASAQGIRAGRAFVELFADDSKLVRGLKRARKRLRAFGASVRAIGAKMFAAGALVAGPLSLAVKAASDMEETMNKFNVVFGKNAQAVKAWGDQFASQVGRSKNEVADFLAGTQDLLVPIGFAPGTAETMSKQLTGLAIDLASFNNKADSDVIRDLHAALTGSSEVMKKYGVIVNETAVKQELFNRGIDKNNATEQQKVMARMAIILRGTTAAQGDAIRSAGSFANQMKALKAKVSDAAVEIGSALLPVVTPLVTKVAAGVKVVAAWIKQHKGLVVILAKVAAALAAGGLAFIVLGTAASGLASTLGVMAAVLSGVGTAIGLLGSLLGALLLPIGLVIAGITALAAHLITSTDVGTQALDFLKGAFGELKDDALSAFQGIADALAAGDISLAAKILWLSLKLEWQKGVNALNQIWVTVKEFFLSTWTDAVFGAAKIATNAWAGLQSAWTETVDFLADAWTLFTTGLTKTWNHAVGFIRKAWVKLKSLFDSDIDAQAKSPGSIRKSPARTVRSKKTGTVAFSSGSSSGNSGSPRSKGSGPGRWPNSSSNRAPRSRNAAISSRATCPVRNRHSPRPAGPGSRRSNKPPANGRLPTPNNRAGRNGRPTCSAGCRNNSPRPAAGWGRRN